jgi:hypothetical protein
MDVQIEQTVKHLTRRKFFGRTAIGIGTAALAGLLRGPEARARTAARLAPHFAPRAKRVIYLFMAGAPSHVDLFDYKPTLVKLDGTKIPAELMAGQRFAFIRDVPNIGAPRWKFIRSPATGGHFSELLPKTASIADRITVIRSMHTEQFNHDPAVTFLQTGAPLPGRPVIGSWLSYGLGSESRDLPAFVVLVSGAPGQPLQTRYWGSGFLPSIHQGVQFRSQGDPVLYVNNPPGISAQTRRISLDAINRLNSWRHETIGDPEIATRIGQFELAYRMQTSVPGLMDISGEPQHVLDLYGAQPGTASFASNCLLARRLVERGVRFVQLYHTDWDHHGGVSSQNLLSQLPLKAQEIDQPAAALIADLEQRGLLDETLVIWGGEFGRTPMVQGQVTSTSMGRDHHPRAYTIWMAGGGIASGLEFGATDDFAYNIVEDPLHVHDFQATILYLLGLDHERLIYRFQGRDFRLTDVHGRVVHKLLA